MPQNAEVSQLTRQVETYGSRQIDSNTFECAYPELLQSSLGRPSTEHHLSQILECSRT